MRIRLKAKEQFTPELTGAPCSGRRTSYFGLYDYMKNLAPFPQLTMPNLS